MFIEKLVIRNFRNYEFLDIRLSSGINFFLGENGAGKTNIIEAVNLLSVLKSFRGVSDKDMIKWGKNSFYCSADSRGDSSGLYEIGFQLNELKNIKKIKKNKNEIAKYSDYYGDLLSVVFSPDDINIITGPPENRRKYFDSLISKTDRLYLKNLSDMKKILLSRNRCLKDISDKISGIDQLETWNELFADRAVYITQKRTEFINKFNKIFINEYGKISDEKNLIIPEINYSNNIDADRNSFLKRLKSNEKIEIIKKMTLSGPQKDDFILKSGEYEFIPVSSQGQKRTAVIALKNAEISFIQEIRGEKAVILIDDIFSELDSKRKKDLIESISLGNQVLLTAVSIENIKEYFSDAQVRIFKVKDGSVFSDEMEN